MFGRLRTDPSMPGLPQTVHLPSQVSLCRKCMMTQSYGQISLTNVCVCMCWSSIQLRYLHFFKKLITENEGVNLIDMLHQPSVITLTSIVIDKPVLAFGKRPRDKLGVWVTITQPFLNDAQSDVALAEMLDKENGLEPLLINCCGIQLRGDLCFRFYADADRRELLSFFWLHSMFLDRKGTMSLNTSHMELVSMKHIEDEYGFRVSVNYQFLGDGYDQDVAAGADEPHSAVNMQNHNSDSSDFEDMV